MKITLYEIYINFLWFSGGLEAGVLAGMVLKIGLVAIKVLEWMFFVGLAGCVTTVLLSWISVWRGSMSDKE